MSLPQALVVSVGGTLSTSVKDRPTNATAEVFDGKGSSVVAAASATVDSISSTLNGAHTKGATSIAVASGTTFSANSEFWLRTPDEKLKVKTVSTNDLELWAPLLYNHATGVNAEGASLSITIAGASVPSLFWDGTVRWLIDGGTIVDDSMVEVVKHPLYRRATYYDVVQAFSKVADLMDSEDNIEDMLDTAHGDLLMGLGGHGRARIFPGSPEFARATAFKLLENKFREVRGAEDMETRYRDAYNAQMELIMAALPQDRNQDGNVEAEEQRGWRNVSLSRS